MFHHAKWTWFTCVALLQNAVNKYIVWLYPFSQWRRTSFPKCYCERNYVCGGNLTYPFGNAREGEVFPYTGTYNGIRGRHVHKASSAVTVLEILRKNQIIWINVFVKWHVHSLKEYERNHFKFQYSWRTLSAGTRERAVPYPDIAHLVREVRPSGGKTAAARFSPETAERTMHTCLPFLTDVSSVGILITIVT
jgi:hypothetical protein